MTNIPDECCYSLLVGGLYEEVYMNTPPGFDNSNTGRMVCKLNKSLYDLKQVSRQWNIKLTNALVSNGYKQSKYDYSLKRKIMKWLLFLYTLMIC